MNVAGAAIPVTECAASLYPGSLDLHNRRTLHDDNFDAGTR